MTWKDILKRAIKIQKFNILLTFYTKSGRPYPPMNIEEEIMDTKEGAIKVAVKKTLQAAEPTEYFGQDFTQLGDLIGMLEELDLIKDDNKMKKRMKSINEQNVDMVATASKLRKQYEQLYRQVRKIVYPKSAGSLRDDEK